MSQAVNTGSGESSMLPVSAGRYSVLACCLINGMLLSYGICVLAMRFIVGPVELPGSTFGISEPNFQLVNLAAMLLTVPMLCATTILFAILKPGQKWWILVPALAIPIVGGCGFMLLLMGGLGT